MSTLSAAVMANGPAVKEPSAGPTASARTPALTGPILLALHGHEASHAAVKAARLLSQRLGVGIEVVTVIEPFGVYNAGLEILPDLAKILEVDVTRHQAGAVERDLCTVMGSENGWHLLVRIGKPAREISRAAAELKPSLIVMDSSPHRSFKGEVAGVRVLQVLRQTTCPVLSTASTFSGPVRRVLAAIDFSPASIRAAEAALPLMDDGATMRLVYAALPLHLDRPIVDRTGAVFGGDVTEAFGRVREELLRAAPPGVTIGTEVLSGNVSDAILKAAAAMEADLITIGSQSRNVVERFFVGSVASHVVHLAPASVLIAPGPAPAEFVRLTLRVHDTAVSSTRDQWKEILDAVSRRNTGRRIRMEVDDPSIGAQVQAQGYAFRGITYDPTDARVEVMLGSVDGSSHLTRTIGNVKSIGINSSREGWDEAVEIAHGHGQTLILFEG